jgi:hypothetical protein
MAAGALRYGNLRDRRGGGAALAVLAGMRVNGPLDGMLRGGVKTSAALPRAIEKCSASSQLGQEQAAFTAPRAKPAARLQVELVCQDETPRFDPFWDAPRLVPGFVAQLMGQVMAGGHEIPPSARQAYRAAIAPPALLLEG